ncbi:hypothetical protein Nepgr_001145 [Nepenthes gracilis]|uniref:SAM domain-containing protein n=1 Tax=Nepenthes gracilis TaxID=150966 RepID=A0AAD3P3X3_NEPGR|nr:hypothetical protein Nepgr_001145 [Nepenthes gracilis]
MSEDDDFQTTPCLPLTASLNQKPTSRRKHNSSPAISSPPTFTQTIHSAKKRRPSPDVTENNLAILSRKQCKTFVHAEAFRRTDPDLISPKLMDTLNERLPSNSDTASCNFTWADKKVYAYLDAVDSYSMESRLLSSSTGEGGEGGCDGLFDNEVDGESSTQLDVLLRLCSDPDTDNFDHGCLVVECPLCGLDISDLNDESRQLHTNACLDKCDTPTGNSPHGCRRPQILEQVTEKSSVSTSKQVDVAPVIEWLHSLGLGKYEDTFVKEEIDWDTLQWLTEEDLISIGINALGPRRKIVRALSEFRKGVDQSSKMETDDSKHTTDRTNNLAVNRLITDYFAGSSIHEKKSFRNSRGQSMMEKSQSNSAPLWAVRKKRVPDGGTKTIPLWCCIPGTPFRVDAFRYLRRDCSHWFLTHFHADHYQGLTKYFSYGKIYCSLITAKLVNLKIGIPWDKLQVLPLNQKISIAGVDVTVFDANHCPGAIIILFEPLNSKAVLHTGDFRFSEEMANIDALHTCPIHTLIIDTTYCDPQYDFPKQEAVIQFVIEAIQAESFNPRTLFLIGCYTIGKERLFLEVARVLHTKVYVTAAKLRVLKCLGLPEEDMQWLTTREQESHIHVAPLWTLASFKRLKQISSQYSDRFSLIVAFSPTGWTFGKGKKKSTGRRWQQGTIIRYEVPYSEHCSFTELKEFVKFLSPLNIIPSVNNHEQKSSNAMIALLTS